MKSSHLKNFLPINNWNQWTMGDLIPELTVIRVLPGFLGSLTKGLSVQQPDSYCEHSEDDIRDAAVCCWSTILWEDWILWWPKAEGLLWKVQSRYAMICVNPFLGSIKLCCDWYKNLFTY